VSTGSFLWGAAPARRQGQKGRQSIAVGRDFYLRRAGPRGRWRLLAQACWRAAGTIA
jgi:hypothetical protein